MGAGALALLALAIRLPFGTRTLYSFDSANYAFALRDYYNVAHHHPHPPGYPLYVAAAKLIDLVVGHPNTSLVLLSTLAAAGAVALTYLLARALFGARVGLIAGLVLTFTVGFWGYSEVAYPYTSLGFWLAAGAMLCHRVLQGRRGLAPALGIVLGAAAGFRWDAPVFLAPLWAWALLSVGWRQRALSVAGFALVCVAWFIPMAALSGGLGGYLEALRLQSDYIVGMYSPLEGGGRAILEFNLAYLVTFMRQMYGLNLILMLYAVGRVFTPRRLATDFRVRFLLVWLLPALLVYLLIHIGEPGYLLSLAPVLAILVALALAELDDEVRLAAAVLASRWRWLDVGGAARRIGGGAVPAVLALLLLWHANAFLRGVGPARLPELRLIDATQTAQLGYIRAHAPPGTALVLAHDRFRQAEYELQGYDVQILFDEYAQGWKDGRTWSLAVPPGARTLYVLDELDLAGTPAATQGRQVVLRDDPRVTLWEFDLRGVRSVEHGYRTLRLDS